MKKLSVMMLTGALLVGTIGMTGCGKDNSAADTNTTAETTTSGTADETADAADTTTENADEAEDAGDFDSEEYISVVSREDGSGTRGAFIELFGVEEKDENGEKVDNTTDEAIVTNSTDVMMTTVAGDEYAIGYCSLGSLNPSVKAVTIDGVEASADNIKNDTYKIARPFNLVTKDGLSDLAQDFMNYILSADGQQVVEDKGYIKAVENAGTFTSNNAEGKIVVSGSSSVTPVMEKLKEAYLTVNTNAEIEIQETDSTSGITDATEGKCDIGMASRDLKEEETGLTSTKLAMDGIAVIVNNDNPTDDLSKDTVKSIFTGESEAWSDVK